LQMKRYKKWYLPYNL